MLEREHVKRILEAALLASGQPLKVSALQSLFDERERPESDLVKDLLQEIGADCQGRGVELAETASGFRFQVPEDLSPWISRLWAEKAPRYSRAMLETLALVAYRQPVTRGDIEEIRGVAVSSNIMRSLQEREWIRVVGHRDVPGRPELFATTRQFLDYFSLKSLNQLPSLAEIKDFEQLDPVLDLPIASSDGDADRLDEEMASSEAPAAEGDAEDEESPQDSEEVMLEEAPPPV